MAHSKLIALLKNASGSDSDVVIDKKIVSDIVDLIKETSEQLKKKQTDV